MLACRVSRAAASNQLFTFTFGTYIQKGGLERHLSFQPTLVKKLMSDNEYSVPCKRLKTASMSKIGTHNGTFHCDDALACWMLTKIPLFKGAKIVRSRSPEDLDACDIVVDVGAVFDHSKRRYDHHQRDFKETFNSLRPEKPWKTKLSSAGLVYIYYGEELIRAIMESNAKEHGLGPVSEESLQLVYDKVYENLIEEIDAVDNGVSLTDETPRYNVTTTLSKRVGNLNPRWNEKSSDEILMERFGKAMEIVSKEFLDRIAYYQLGWLTAHSVVKDAIMNRFKIHSSGEIICFEQSGIPWKDHVMGLEKELNVETTIKYILYQDLTNKRWRIQCVPISPDSFKNRLSLPAEWCGIRDEALSELSGIPACVFVHANGFIGGNQTYEGVLQMGIKSLELGQQAN